MIPVDEDFMDSLLLKVMPELKKSTANDDLKFEANPNLGEGTATKEELKQRNTLISPNEDFYNKFKKLLLNKEQLAEDKIKAVDDSIDSLMKDAQDKVQSSDETRYQSGYDDMNTTLKDDYKVKVPKQEEDQPRLNSILRQQLMNIEDAYLVLRGRLRQIINITDVNSYYASVTPTSTIKKAINKSSWTPCMKEASKENPDMDEEELREYCENINSTDSAFKDNNNRLDQLGMFGWVESQKAGWLEAGLFGAATLTLAIEVDWVTMEDSDVCEYCQDNADNSPWSILEIPEEHYGGRCKLVVAGVEFDA